jgi:hypothetical protein
VTAFPNYATTYYFSLEKETYEELWRIPVLMECGKL